MAKYYIALLLVRALLPAAFLLSEYILLQYFEAK